MITFVYAEARTIRPWKATIEYHKTKDILYVKNLLGHKKIENTEIYITLEKIYSETRTTKNSTRK